MAAFWEDPTWIILWPKDITLDFLIEQSAKRQARNLLQSRQDRRHQKAVDPVTNAVVGYARWILPSGHVTTEEGGPEWVEAQVPDVSEEEKKHFEELAQSAWWNPGSDMGEIDEKNEEVMERILAEKPYITLDYLAVHPENKRKGIATALVESGIHCAEKIGLPIFILAFKAGRSIYERLGFKEVYRVIQDDSKYGGQGEYGAYFMVYDVSRTETR
ncbi:hypothetical protein BGW36DRAFT_361834 [Talaromyces proteolyticus]|uniref:N-acetyltransferase domain-containing protein n=1 Tax=Talaromyces proteolyticus TaxID=1131652 RepID=A0AAD4PVY6_9EURO|nr:uncharacterized protein BGW36DRAFT_361834 [Talaromyces proteolyticus]KAH8694012.1 hypothetical protein BGW36DRAFT_361834 [Talaromyces proteolyticus]